MNVFKRWIQKLSSWSFLKKLLPSLLVLALIVMILISFRSCTHSPPRKLVYIIGRDRSFYTLQLLGRERNLLAFTNDLIATISQESGLRFAWLDSNPGTLFEALDNEACDAILSSVRPNNFNQEKYVFSELIFKTGPVLILKKDSPNTSLKQMEGLTLGIAYGTATLFDSVREKGANSFEVLLVNYYDVNKTLEALSRNQIDGAIVESIPAYSLLSGIYSDVLKIVTHPLTDEGLRLIALKNETAENLISEFNASLRKLKNNGIYDSLIDKWNLFDADKNFMLKEKNS